MVVFAAKGSKVPPPEDDKRRKPPIAREDWGKQPMLPFPRNLSLPVRFYRAMFINPNINVLASLDKRLVNALHGQVEFWVRIDLKFRETPGAAVQDLVKDELAQIFARQED